MSMGNSSVTRTGRRYAPAVVALTVASLLVSATPGLAQDDAASDEGPIAISLITKNNTNPFFISMQNGAKEAAEPLNVDLTLAAGSADGDEQGQVAAIENAISKGDVGILITPNGPGVNGAMEKARAEGLYVIALDTPPDPPETVDITFATDNLLAGELIGQWAAEYLDGEDAVIAIIDAFSDILVATDYRRHHGFLTGMGIELGDPIIMGDQPMEGEYTGGKGGSYVIACNEAGQAAEPESRTAMENCLSRNPDINVVYAINEPAAFGALSGLKAAGKDDQAVIATIDGGCAAVQSMQSGSAIKATSQQYPLRMASLGMEAIASIARGGEAPEVTEGLDFYNTGVELVTDMPMDGIPSITSDEGAEICWGA